MSEFPGDFKELVRSRTDIVSLIGESLTLQPQRGGLEYAALCPFHDDSNPSLKVYPDRQSYRCWVCNEGGDVFTWVMKRENLEFREALEALAERAHIEIPKRSRRQAGDAARKQDLYAVLKWAELQFHECLFSPAGQEALAYLTDKRGYTRETIEQFRIGFHPDDWEWLQRRNKGQFPASLLEQARIIKKRDGSAGYSDEYVDRVLFPIRDERSRTVAFGGRVLPGHSNEKFGKYWNGRESPVFQKHRVLYGLAEAREAIRDTKSVLVTEGYADCVACHMAGVRNVVATLGTALTETHVSRLKAFAPKIVMVYDGDAAGQRAAARAVPMLLGQSIDLRVLTLPEGQDPDDYLGQHGREAFEDIVSRAPEAWEFQLEYEAAQVGLDSVNGQEHVLNEMLSLLAKVPGLRGTAREDLILGRLASRLRLPETKIRAHLEQARKRTNTQRPNNSNKDQSPRSYGRQTVGSSSSPPRSGERSYDQRASRQASERQQPGKTPYDGLPRPSNQPQQNPTASEGHRTNQAPPLDFDPETGQFIELGEYPDQYENLPPEAFGGTPLLHDSPSRDKPLNDDSESRPTVTPNDNSTFDPQSFGDTPQATDPAHVHYSDERIEFHLRPLSKDDQLECELLEILLTRPDLGEQARQEVGEDDILNPHLRALLQIVYDQIELGHEPTFERVTLSTENLELKGLTIWITDQAREKGVERKLQLDGEDSGPGLFQQNLDRLKWRREERRHQADLSRQAMAGSGTEDDVRAKLSKASAFHRKRVSR